MKSRRLKKACASRPKNSRSAKLVRRRRKASSSRRNPIVFATAPKPGTASKEPVSFTSLDFPNRQLLYPHEIADRLGCSIRHVKDLITEGQLRALDISGTNAGEHRTFRVPIESWRKFLSERTV